MTKIVVMSDTHGDRFYFNVIAPVVESCDILIHLGDGNKDCMSFATQAQKVLIRGNNDFSGEEQSILEVGNHKLFLTHGHRYDVDAGSKKLSIEARRLGCDIALYGHTHMYEDVTHSSGVRTICPGALSRYSIDGASYVLMLDAKHLIVRKVNF